jgi:hypothetical protein
VQLCKRRKNWFDGCQEKRVAIQSVSFDPIVRQYEVRRDLLGDLPEPEVKNFRNLRDALRFASRTAPISLAYLSRGDTDFLTNPRSYVSVNVEETCEGEYNETLSSLSYVLTLGLMDLRHEQSGWWDFPLLSLTREHVRKEPRM